MMTVAQNYTNHYDKKIH